MDISGEQLPSMPVVVAFELDGSALREYLLPENIADAAVYVLSADGTPLFSVGNAVALSPLTFDANQTAFQGEYRILRRVSPSGRQYLLQLPNSLAQFRRRGSFCASICWFLSSRSWSARWSSSSRFAAP